MKALSASRFLFSPLKPKEKYWQNEVVIKISR